MIQIITHKVDQKRHKELYITAQNDGEPYIVTESEKIIFGVKLTQNSDYAIKKELTAADYDETLHKYKVVLSSDDTDVTPGRYYFDAVLVDTNGEMYGVGSGRIKVIASTVK